MPIKAAILQQGDMIGSVTLESSLDAATINARIETVRRLGFSVILGKYVYAVGGYLAGTDQQRVKDFIDMVRNPNVMILPTREGVSVVGILPYLVYQEITNSFELILSYLPRQTLRSL
jgi:muramoyltetrapeptide carboxypeptidase